MKFSTKLLSNLPPLAWLAICNNVKRDITVFHGERVEIGDDYCVAAVWDGDFKKADFDKTDIIAGTGIRLRNETAVFVTPGNPLDRIAYYTTGYGFLVSNSLPAIFSFADLTPIKGYDYQRDFETIAEGLRKYKRTIPTSKNPVCLTYFNNLLYDGSKFTEIDKPDCAPHFYSFNDYREYLFNTSDRVAANACDPNRKIIIEVTSTCSSGYDSALATVLAKRMGSKKVLSIGKARSLFSIPDSGEKVAEALGLPCEVKASILNDYKNEEAIWVSMGDALDLHLTVFDFPKPLSLILTGFHGDTLWERTPIDITEFLSTHSPSGSSFSEWGLQEGVIQMSIGYWALRRGKDIQNISILDEMKPWTLFNNYDRPTPRRIIEEAGVARGDFAYKKRVATIASDWLPNPWPYSKNLRRQFKKFAKAENIYIPPYVLIVAWRLLNSINWHILRRVGLLFGDEERFTISWAPFKTRWIFFYWAMSRMKARYVKAFEHCRTL